LRVLFDVNVLIALLDEKHVHHQKATTWLSQNGPLGWVSCAITINGCARLTTLNKNIVVECVKIASQEHIVKL
jgi:predicted nucleic acid-binding protein